MDGWSVKTAGDGWICWLARWDLSSCDSAGGASTVNTCAASLAGVGVALPGDAPRSKLLHETRKKTRNMLAPFTLKILPGVAKRSLDVCFVNS